MVVSMEAGVYYPIKDIHLRRSLHWNLYGIIQSLEIRPKCFIGVPDPCGAANRDCPTSGTHIHRIVWKLRRARWPSWRLDPIQTLPPPPSILRVRPTQSPRPIGHQLAHNCRSWNYRYLPSGISDPHKTIPVPTEVFGKESTLRWNTAVISETAVVIQCTDDSWASTPPVTTATQAASCNGSGPGSGSGTSEAASASALQPEFPPLMQVSNQTIFEHLNPSLCCPPQPGQNMRGSCLVCL